MRVIQGSITVGGSTKGLHSGDSLSDLSVCQQKDRFVLNLLAYGNSCQIFRHAEIAQDGQGGHRADLH
ncbi:MAG TPA: hypothetical protein DCX09_03840 [Gammaproteobacteria bacterium]|nr:hypothetical protein [Gammaproteobacteria bacterium]